MKIRAAAVAGLSIVGILAGTGHAATAKKVCNLITDVSGDTTFGGAVPTTQPTLDILGGDIVTDDKMLTAVIRVAAIGTEATAPLGETWSFKFLPAGSDATLFVSYLKTPNAAVFQYGNVSGSLLNGEGEAKGVIVTDKKEIHVTVPLAALSAHVKIKSGTKLTALSIISSPYNGVYVNSGAYAGSTPQADGADASKSYDAGTPSCIKVNA